MKRAIYLLAVAGLAACSADPDPITGGPVTVGMMPAQPPATATAGAAAPAAADPVVNMMPPAAATAGTTAAPPMVPPPTATAGTTAVMMPPVDEPVKLAMDECDLNTGFSGDEFCIKPPPTAEGFQMHIGPSNYNNPEPRYVLEPGQELTESFSATAGNASNVYYYWRQYRMRPGSHHLIIYAGARRIGGSSNSAKDNPEGGKIEPDRVH